jgi:hypothetical protein
MPIETCSRRACCINICKNCLISGFKQTHASHIHKRLVKRTQRPSFVRPRRDRSVSTPAAVLSLSRLPGPISNPQPLPLFLHAARPPLRAVAVANLHASCLPWARYGVRPILPYWSVLLCLASCFRFFCCSRTFRGLLFSSPLFVPRQ